MGDPVLMRRQVVRWLALVVAAVSAAGLAATVAMHTAGPDHRWARGLDHLFDLDLEQNVPTFVSTALLVLAGGLLGLTGVVVRRRGEPRHRLWLLLSAIFLALGYDEFGAVHEMTITLFRGRFGLGSLAWFGWVVPASVVVTLFALAYLRFLVALRPPVRRRFILCGVVYVGAALGLDVIGGPIAVSRGESSGLYIASQWVQEVLEMGAMVGFVNALLVQLELVTGGAGVALRLAPAAAPATAPTRAATPPPFPVQGPIGVHPLIAAPAPISAQGPITAPVAITAPAPVQRGAPAQVSAPADPRLPVR